MDAVATPARGQTAREQQGTAPITRSDQGVLGDRLLDGSEQIGYKECNPVIWRWEAQAFGGPRWGPFFLVCARSGDPHPASSDDLTGSVPGVLVLVKHRDQSTTEAAAPRTALALVDRRE